VGNLPLWTRSASWLLSQDHSARDMRHDACWDTSIEMSYGILLQSNDKCFFNKRDYLPLYDLCDTMLHQAVRLSTARAYKASIDIHRTCYETLQTLLNLVRSIENCILILSTQWAFCLIRLLDDHVPTQVDSIVVAPQE
jgi:hypothetical protein